MKDMPTTNSIPHIKKKIKKAYKKNNYLLLKKAIQLKFFGIDFNFDTMYALHAKHNTLEFRNKKFLHLGHLRNLNDIPLFKTYLDYMATSLKDIFNIGTLDFFYSTIGVVGPSHIDKEHVIILGIKNATYYHLNNSDVKIEAGDILYIPKDVLHHSFSSRERIILSLSLWEKARL